MRQGRERATTRRGGGSLAELLVAMTILAIGGSLNTRLFVLATRELETAELGLRAVQFLGELHEGGMPGGAEGTGGPTAERAAGPGTLVWETGNVGELRVRYDPPAVGEGAASEVGGPIGFFRPMVWSLEDDT